MSESWKDMIKEQQTCSRDFEYDCGSQDDCSFMSARCVNSDANKTAFIPAGKGSRGKCVCNVGDCWAWMSTECVGMATFEDTFRELNAKKETLTASVNQTEIRRSFEDWRLFAVKVTGLAHGVANGLASSKALVDFLVIVGPGIVIAAFTAKLIFATSAIPGRFIQFFPLCFCPLVWSFNLILMNLVPQVTFMWTMMLWAFWPIPVALHCTYDGYHLPMSDERVVHLANKQLILYYFYLLCSYALVAYWLLLPSPADNWNQSLDDIVRSALYKQYVGDATVGEWVAMLFRNFNVYVLTCLAVTDAFITLIVEEHVYAYGELEDDLPDSMALRKIGSGSPSTSGVKSAQCRSKEKGVIGGWITLMRGQGSEGFMMPETTTCRTCQSDVPYRSFCSECGEPIA